MAVRGHGIAILGCGIAAAALPSAAQTDAEAAAMNMRLAATLCLQNVRTPGGMAGAFEAAGFVVTPGMDAGTHEVSAPGVSGLLQVRTPREGYCTVMSPIVDLAMANAIGRAITVEVAPQAWVPGQPDQQAGAPVGPCGGFTNWDVTPIVTLRYAAAGNSGECIDDGTSAIIIN
ncbi:hypothetical protein P6F26_15800 [Roseibacterium sp. SDUM158017]|uniref:hypothetical protein n=1 Tax=Roseicyclus salinarum TaxID=3036773 RepID=UPI002415414A|nr:hypothetical protein [Roseibacterium sp. SDUM158017]MDG4649910.1 hypothetical protein [Roseibacterium sp. SDUM158017]